MKLDYWTDKGCRNITIATFADMSLYKKEGYDASLRAGKILAEHGVPVAYKSVCLWARCIPFEFLTPEQDHFEENTNAKYLL
jgi:hypothetical protein